MIYLEDLLKATDGMLYPNGGVGHRPSSFSGFAFDSRQVEPGQLFLAVKTATGDGHDYIGHALTQGASGVLCEDAQAIPGDPGRVTTILVSDTQQALTDYAAYILNKYRPRVIGVTGSNGKTSTKEVLAAILQKKYRVFKNFGSYNGRYGLPIALGALEAQHEVAVLEMACDTFGEIADLARVTRPEVGVVTMINQNHLSYLGTLNNIAAEKGRLVEALPFNGAAILNADDPRVAGMVPRTQAKILTFGLNPGADVRASAIKVRRNGLTFTIHHEGKSYSGQTLLLGAHQIYPVLAALTTALIFEIPLEAALDTLRTLARVPGRMNPLPGRQGSLIVDDTFNAGPEAMAAALDTLAALPGATKIAILGDMPDLGEKELVAHLELGRYAAGRVDRLVTKGEVAQQIAVAAREAGLGKHATYVTFTSDDAVAAIEHLLSPETVVLVKGGATARMEQVVQKLLAQPELDQAQLVRQGAGWQQIRGFQPERPTWVEINLEAIANNVRLLRQIVQPAKIMAILKADAYGHGTVKVARTVLNNGVSWLAVATLGEAITLRRAGIDAPILVLSYMPAWQAHKAVAHNISATIFSEEIARAFSRAANELNATAYVHVKVDSGMGRLGLLPHQVAGFLRAIELPGLKVEGLFTHLATADEADLSYAKEQVRRFQALLAQLEEENLRPPLIHAANTAGLLNLPEAHFDMVRPGVGLYGLPPSMATPLPPGFQPALTFKTTVGQVKTLPPGSPIGYGATYITQKEETIAIIPVGYADGFRRGPRTWREVLIKGRRAPLVGRVSMDQSAIDVTDIPNVRQGDEVVLIGQQGTECITAEEVAENLGTINYEVVSQLLPRVPRIS
jgi:alanine racemase